MRDGWSFYATNLLATVAEAVRGFAWGTGLALLLASLVLLAPRLERVIMQVAVLSYCIPLVAITPILYIVIGPPPAGRAVRHRGRAGRDRRSSSPPWSGPSSGSAPPSRAASTW